jgi:Arc/MetJ-type ribon-helix-helix transcriptional regulator
MQAHAETKTVKRLNATLPDPLARYVGSITGRGGDYETPSEFIRDLVRRHMENSALREERELQSLLMRSMAENDYANWTPGDLSDLRSLTEG